MRKIKYHIACSIDGFITDKNKSVKDFLMNGEHVDDFKKSLESYDTVIMGRSTYEFGFQFGLKAGEPAYKGLKHIIISNTMKFEGNDDVKLVSENIAKNIINLKSEKGKDIWLCGGGLLASYLLKNNLIDELTLKVNPFVLGNGTRLFEDDIPTGLFELIETKSYSNSVRLDKYVILS